MPTFLLVAIAASVAAGWSGDFQGRYHLALERVLHGGPPRYTVEFVTADAVPRHVRRFTEFSGDVSGRYLEALAVCARERADLAPMVNAVADAVIAHQRPDGHFGEPFADGPITQKHMAMLWGNGRLLVGLVEAHRLTRRADVLEAARGLGGFFLSVAPRLNDEAVRREYSGAQVAVGYICWTQIVEGLVGLHEATRDARYLELGRQIAARTGRHPSQHSHGYLTSLRGILRLHQATGDLALLDQVEREWEELIASGNVFVHGAVPEAFKPIAKRDEGCSEADWLRLNLALWSATGKARYLEQAELTLFNEFAFNQFRTGDFGHRELTDEGVAAWGARAWWCCTFHGLRAYPDLFRAAFRSEDKALHYDLPISGQATSGELAMSAASGLGKDGTVALQVLAAAASPVLLSIRVPAWAASGRRHAERPALWRGHRARASGRRPAPGRPETGSSCATRSGPGPWRTRRIEAGWPSSMARGCWASMRTIRRRSSTSPSRKTGSCFRRGRPAGSTDCRRPRVGRPALAPSRRRSRTSDSSSCRAATRFSRRSPCCGRSRTRRACPTRPPGCSGSGRPSEGTSDAVR